MLGNIKWVARALTIKDWGASERVSCKPQRGFFHIYTCVFWQSKCQNFQLSDRKIMHSMVSYRFWLNSSSDAVVRTWRDKQNTRTSKLQLVTARERKENNNTAIKRDCQDVHLPLSYCWMLLTQKSWEKLLAICFPVCAISREIKRNEEGSHGKQERLVSFFTYLGLKE